ncbi:MAG: hypothetical protein ACD_83C00129G0001 [uncultured bacterium]|nr:MAG: hypothetical protein ACD_83C00129G0001 [uncultured bacterium]
MNNKYQVKLINKYQLATGTVAFEIEKPEAFIFAPGQTIDVSLLHSTDLEIKERKRIFAIASSPLEKNLLFITKMTHSLFKQKLDNLKINGTLEVAGPYGIFKIQENAQVPAVFIAGGVGIAPFRSMVINDKDRDFPHRITLFFSNKDSQKVPFHYTFSNISHAHFQYVPTISGQTTDWQGEVGRINRQMIQKYILNFTEPIYYLAGPKQMVESMKKMILGLGVSADHIKQSIFIGY